MPKRPLKPCRCAGCTELTAGRYCEKHSRLNMVMAKPRLSATECGYNERWRKARRIYLNEHPLCVECMKYGKLTEATVVDHIIPHKGDYTLFWDEDNWQALCKQCHDRKTATEDGGFGRDVKAWR